MGDIPVAGARTGLSDLGSCWAEYRVGLDVLVFLSTFPFFFFFPLWRWVLTHIGSLSGYDMREREHESQDFAM